MRPHLAAVAFFDQFDRPLTSAEAVRFALGRADAVAALDVQGAVRTDGRWHLPGREEVVAERDRRYLLSQRKFARARRVAWWMARVPSVRMVAVCNSLALANAKEDSDIDLFVVAAPGTVWITRFLTVPWLMLLRMRPDERTHRSRVCMSFFVDETAMDLSGVRMGEDDPGFLHFVAAFVPLYDADEHRDEGVARRFFAANGWVREHLPGWIPEDRSLRWGVAPVRGHGWASALLRPFERPARRLQEWWFPDRIRSLVGKDTRVVTTDRMLKFHVHDRRDEQLARFRDTLSSLST